MVPYEPPAQLWMTVRQPRAPLCPSSFLREHIAFGELGLHGAEHQVHVVES